jgi:hypothetical protein
MSFEASPGWARTVIPEDEALKLIERLERHSRRSRPFLLYGLVAIVAGFLTFTLYLERQKDRLEQQKDRLEQQKGQLVAERDKLKVLSTNLAIKKNYLESTLASARRVAGRSASDPSARAELATILGMASSEVSGLNALVVDAAEPAAAAATPAETKAGAEAIEEARPVPPPGPPSLPPTVRLVIHIASADQRRAIAQFQLLLGTRLGESTIDARDVRFSPGEGDNSLRCFKRLDCTRVADLAAKINKLLRAPLIRINDLSRIYEQERDVKPGTYQLWFAPGRIELQPLGA